MATLLLLIGCGMEAQSVPAGEPPVVTASVVHGRDAGSSIEYALIPLSGKLWNAPAGTKPPEPAPRLTAQCTQTPDGKQRFELLVDSGGVSNLRFFPPWHQTATDLYPPRLTPVTVTMEFLGYTKVKPVKRAWVRLNELPEELRYATPGASSSNMESIMFYLQYLRALPTLHLTWQNAGKGDTVVLEFSTLAWQDLIRKEPLCHASGL